MSLRREKTHAASLCLKATRTLKGCVYEKRYMVHADAVLEQPQETLHRMQTSIEAAHTVKASSQQSFGAQLNDLCVLIHRHRVPRRFSEFYKLLKTNKMDPEKDEQKVWDFT